MIEPFPHQNQGARYLMERNGGYLFWKMRTGKTLTAIYGVIDSRHFPILVITKPSIMETWRKAFTQDFGMKEDSVLICKPKYPRNKREAILERGRIVICNYESCIPYRVMTAQPWGAIIYDESYAIANLSAKITRYIVRSIPKQPAHQRRIALTGTPAAESPLQYATQFFAVDGRFMGYDNVEDYIFKNWEPLRSNPNKMVVREKAHLEALHAYIHEHASFLSLEDLGLGSTKLYDVRMVPMNDKQVACLEWARVKKNELNKRFRSHEGVPIGDMVYGLYENMVSAGIHPLNKEIISTAKIDDVLACYKDNPEPILVLSYFVDLLPMAKDLAMREGIKCDYIDGSISKEKAERIRSDFQAGYLDIVFTQSQVASEGLDFSRANLTYYLNNSFSLDLREQTEMRTTNINKKVPVGIIDICTTGTLDVKILQKLRAKEKISSQFLDREGWLK